MIILKLVKIWQAASCTLFIFLSKFELMLLAGINLPSFMTWKCKLPIKNFKKPSCQNTINSGTTRANTFFFFFKRERSELGLLWSTLLTQPRVALISRQTERERQRNGASSSPASPCPSTTPNPNPNRTRVGPATGIGRRYSPPDVFARRRSPHQGGGRRQSPLRRQELPQSRSWQGTPLSVCFPRKSNASHMRSPTKKLEHILNFNLIDQNLCFSLGYALWFAIRIW